MGETTDNFSTVASAVAAAANDDDIKFGFQRPEMYQSNLAGTVNPYDRHVFLCYKSHEFWPSRVEDSDSDPLPKLLSAALKASKNDINGKTRLTICEGREGTLSDGDVLIFPEMVKYRGLEDSVVDSFVEDVLVNGKPWSAGVREALTGSHVFVCAHKNRDQRCGVCGPALIEKFKEEIESKGLTDQVLVTACSHIGGHKYAGNVIIFGAEPDGKISGHWYGYVASNDVPELLDQHITKGEIIERLWRGQMGAPVKEAENETEEKIPNGIDANSENRQDSNSEEKQENVTSCCQGLNRFSCCRDGRSLEEKPGQKKLLSLPSWVTKWEQREVITAVAVIGAVATVAVAYSFYRRSR